MDKISQVAARAYDELALVYEEEMKTPYQVFFRERVKKILCNWVKDGSKILDIGTGLGFPSSFLAKRNCRIGKSS